MKRPKLFALGGKEEPPETRTMQDYYRALETDVLARTLWGEARGEGMQGMEAVAAVILNRVRHAEAQGRFWWGGNIIQVCQKPYQFSCWNRSDPNFRKPAGRRRNGSLFCDGVAHPAARGGLDDATGGATHYPTP